MRVLMGFIFGVLAAPTVQQLIEFFKPTISMLLEGLKKVLFC